MSELMGMSEKQGARGTEGKLPEQLVDGQDARCEIANADANEVRTRPADATGDANELIAILDDEPDEGEQESGADDDEGTSAEPVDREADEGTTSEEASDAETEAEGSKSAESEPSDVADELGKSTEGRDIYNRRCYHLPAETRRFLTKSQVR